MLDYFEWDGERKRTIINNNGLWGYYGDWYPYSNFHGDDLNYEPIGGITLDVLNLIENL